MTRLCINDIKGIDDWILVDQVLTKWMLVCVRQRPCPPSTSLHCPKRLLLTAVTGMIHTSCARRMAALETYPITSKADLPKTATIDKLSSNLSTDKGP